MRGCFAPGLRADPDGLRQSARVIASGKPIESGTSAAKLKAYLDRRVGPGDEGRLDWRTMYVLKNDPEALVEAVEILIARPDAVRAVLLRSGYTDIDSIGGYLDRDLVARKPR